MKILLSNDDGINARGIEAMRDALAKVADVFVVAPETEMSAVGHAITITDPLRVRKVMRDGSLFGIAVDGTPADCVKIAARAILAEKPDIVISGINQGQNVATNVIYSGTVSAATEGMILGIPSIAISLASFTSRDFSVAAEYGVKMALMVKEKGLPDGVLLNVNVPAIPADRIKGVKACRMGVSRFREVFEKRVDPRQNDYYWQGGEMVFCEEDADADIGLIEKGYVTVTPIHFNLTNRDFLENMKGWEF